MNNVVKVLYYTTSSWNTACVVDGTHTIKTWTGVMKWNTYRRAWIWKPFTIVLFVVRRRPEVCCLCLVTAAENGSVQFVFWSLRPLNSKTCLLRKWLPLSAVKALVIFHVRCDRWCLYCCDSERTIFLNFEGFIWGKNLLFLYPTKMKGFQWKTAHLT